MLQTSSENSPSPSPLTLGHSHAALELSAWRARLFLEDLRARTVYPRGAERSYVRLPSRAGCEVWLIAWPPGSGVPLHDHGEASALVTMLSGELQESLLPPDGPAVERSWRRHGSLEIPRYARHTVWNASEQTAYSLHVYTPQLAAMTFYERLASGELRALRSEEAAQW